MASQLTFRLRPALLLRRQPRSSRRSGFCGFFPVLWSEALRRMYVSLDGEDRPSCNSVAVISSAFCAESPWIRSGKTIMVDRPTRRFAASGNRRRQHSSPGWSQRASRMSGSFGGAVPKTSNSKGHFIVSAAPSPDYARSD